MYQAGMSRHSERTARGKHALPGRYLNSQRIFESETHHIFNRDWLYACRSSELTAPGAFVLRGEVNSKIIILRDEDGAIRAFHNVCRHRGTELCSQDSGHFERSIRCPYHAWTYALDGTLIGAPNMKEVEEFQTSDHRLASVAVAEWAGFIFFNLSPEPVPFKNAFAPLLHRFEPWLLHELQPVARRFYSVKANWKLIFQNYSECYHCPSIHPALSRLTPFRDSSNDLEEGPFLGGPMNLSKGVMSMTTDGKRCAPSLGGITGELLERVYYYTIFPSLFLSLHPDYVLVHRLVRLGTQETEIECEWLFNLESLKLKDFDPHPAIDFWDLTNRQDWAICEASHRGIRSQAFVPGPYSNLESVLVEFDRYYLSRLGETG